MKVLESSKTYHQNPALGSSKLKSIHKRTLLHALTEVIDEEKDSLIVGSGLHCSVLDPERFGNDFISLPEDAPRRPSSTQLNAKKPSDETLKAIQFWAAFEEMTKDKTILEPKHLELINGMKESIMSHPIALEMLTGGEAEYSYYVKDPETGLDLKCRPDYHNGGALIDIKTTADASFEGFARQIGNLGYHLQAAYYLDVFNASQGTDYKDFFFIAVENKTPHALAVYRLDEVHIEFGRKAYRKALRQYADFLTKGSFDDLKTMRNFGYPMEIIDIQVPHYILDKIDFK